MSRRISALLCVLLALPVGYIAIQSLIVLQRHYTWREMDWNNDGRTTLSEFFASARIDHWTVRHGGLRCNQYYSTHALTAVKTVCPNGSVAAVADHAATPGG